MSKKPHCRRFSPRGCLKKLRIFINLCFCCCLCENLFKKRKTKSSPDDGVTLKELVEAVTANMRVSTLYRNKKYLLIDLADDIETIKEKDIKELKKYYNLKASSAKLLEEMIDDHKNMVAKTELLNKTSSELSKEELLEILEEYKLRRNKMKHSSPITPPGRDLDQLILDFSLQGSELFLLTLMYDELKKKTFVVPGFTIKSRITQETLKLLLSRYTNSY